MAMLMNVGLILLCMLHLVMSVVVFVLAVNTTLWDVSVKSANLYTTRILQKTSEIQMLVFVSNCWFVNKAQKTDITHNKTKPPVHTRSSTCSIYSTVLFHKVVVASCSCRVKTRYHVYITQHIHCMLGRTAFVWIFWVYAQLQCNAYTTITGILNLMYFYISSPTRKSSVKPLFSGTYSVHR